MVKVLAFDPGSTMGIAVFTEEGKLITAEEHLIKTSKDSLGYAMVRLEAALLKVKTAHPADSYVFVIEDVKRHLGTIAAHTYGAIIGMLQYIAFKDKTPIAWIGVKTSKKIATGNGNADKAAIVLAANKLFEGSITPKNHNAADAVCLGFSYFVGKGIYEAAPVHSLKKPKRAVASKEV